MRTDTRVITKSNFSKQAQTSNFKMSKYLRAHGKPWIERVLTPSLSIIYLPYSETSRKRFFSIIFPFPLLDKIKVSGDSCLPRHFANTNAKCKPAFLNKQSRFWPLYHKTGDSAGEIIGGVHLRISSSYCFQMFDLFALYLWALYQSYYRS